MCWRGFGFVHRSRTLFCRAVPNLSITIRNFCIAVGGSHSPYLSPLDVVPPVPDASKPALNPSSLQSLPWPLSPLWGRGCTRDHIVDFRQWPTKSNPTAAHPTSSASLHAQSRRVSVAQVGGWLAVAARRVRSFVRAAPVPPAAAVHPRRRVRHPRGRHVRPGGDPPSLTYPSGGGG
jgi:hypothetical protein